VILRAFTGRAHFYVAYILEGNDYKTTQDAPFAGSYSR
jgi:hypothetical protein